MVNRGAAKLRQKRESTHSSSTLRHHNLATHFFSRSFWLNTLYLTAFSRVYSNVRHNYYFWKQNPISNIGVGFGLLGISEKGWKTRWHACLRQHLFASPDLQMKRLAIINMVVTNLRDLSPFTPSSC
jgi:hypothetical protein